MLPGLAPSVAGKRLLQLEYLDLRADNDDLSSYTFAGFPLGRPAVDRNLIALAAAGFTTGRQISSLTIAGATATVRDEWWNANNYLAVATTASPLTSGETGSVVMAMNGGCSRGIVGMYRMRGGNPVPHDSDVVVSVGSSSQSITVEVPAGGVIVALAYLVTELTSWTNATQDEYVASDGSASVAVASNTGPFETTQNVTVTADPARSLVVASFAPV